MTAGEGSARFVLGLCRRKRVILTGCRMGNGNGEEGNDKAAAVDEGRRADPEDVRAREDEDNGDRAELSGAWQLSIKRQGHSG
jgi:hypothetical protein